METAKAAKKEPEVRSAIGSKKDAKTINILAVLSFVGTAGIIGSGYYLYTQKDPIIEGLKEKVTKAKLWRALPTLYQDC